MIGKVQALEEKKLNAVVDLQLARQQALDKLRNIFPNKEKVKIDWGVILKE